MGKTLAELLHEHFGVKTSFNENPEVIQVEVAVTKVFNYNPNRLGLVLINTSGFPILVGYKNDVTVGNGILLVANGGSLSLIWNEDFELVASEMFAIADGGAATIYTNETVSI
ncbi:hypothetical protein LCGC14_2901320 [marine sediment metagenome]|uniref:Uncharacterized protein n=1 Tax=marine sediment metagenome TaxID=412755 RepID=A0A0F8XU91_9ZZZZ